MESLADRDCADVEHGAIKLPQDTAEQYHQQLPGWEMVTENGEQRLKRVFKFKNFSQALEFTNRVGRIAEEQNHHPALLTEWGRVTVWWWTHTVHGLHMNDFIMAAKTDRLSAASQ